MARMKWGYKSMHKHRVTLNVVFTTIVYIVLISFLSVIVYNVYNLYSGKGQTKEISVFGYRPVIVVSGSMLPSIQVNSISIMKYCDIDSVAVGDVIMYINPENSMRITHRVIAINQDSQGHKYLTTRGDANNEADNISITSNLVVGKLIKTYNGIAPIITKAIGSNKQADSGSLSKVVIAVVAAFTAAALLLNAAWVWLNYLIVALRKKDNYQLYLDDMQKNLDRAKDLHEKFEGITGNSFEERIRRAKAIRAMKQYSETTFSVYARFIKLKKPVEHAAENNVSIDADKEEYIEQK